MSELLPIGIAFLVSLAYSAIFIMGIRRKVDMFSMVNWFLYASLISIMAIMAALLWS